MNFEEIKEYYTKTTSLSKVAERFNTSRHLVKKLLLENGIEINSTPQKKNCPDIEKFSKLYLKSSNNNACMETFKVSNSQVHVWATKLGLKREAVDYSVDIEKLHDMYYNQGKTFLELSEIFGISNVTLKKRYVEAGYKVREHSDTQKITSIKTAATKLEKHGYMYFPEGIAYGIRSKNEIEIQDILNSYGFSFHTNTTILSGKHIDAYDNNLKLGIEYSGTWCHHENFPGKNKNYHFNKWNICKENGVKLITIWDYEYIEKRDIIVDFLKANCGIFDKRIYARNCRFIELDYKPHSFFTENHIQGTTQYLDRIFGLIYEDELVGCVSYGRHHRDNNKMSLNRLAFKRGIQIIGGASKLVKNSLQIINQKVLTSSDNRWSTGEIYLKCGFVNTKNYGPDYFYTHNSKYNLIKSKQSMQKSQIGCPNDMTERDYCLSLGWNRVWDCGKRSFEWVP